MAKGNQLNWVTAERNRAKQKYRNHPTAENKEALARAYAAQYAIYNELKTKYYDELFGQLDGDKRKFYQLMKSKRTEQTKLPEIMYRNGDRLRQIDLRQTNSSSTNTRLTTCHCQQKIASYERKSIIYTLNITPISWQTIRFFIFLFC